MMEMKLVLPIILQRFRLSLSQNSKVDRSGLIFSVPKGGLLLRLHVQDRQFASSDVRGNIRFPNGYKAASLQSIPRL